MPSTSSSVQRARKAVADRLREIRVRSGLTATELAARAGWHRTKVSKIEAGGRVPRAEVIRTWCEHCGAHDQVEELLDLLVAADTMWTEWRRVERAGLRHVQEAVVPLWERTRRFRIYSPWLVPGPVQHADYIRALLTGIRDRRALADDVEEATAVRVAKQHVVHEGDHTFAVVLEEATLHYRIGGAEVLHAQLSHLLEVMSAPSVSLGIIPSTADRSELWPVEMFFMFDNVQVDAEFVSGWLRVTTASDIAMYARTFEVLSGMAVYGNAARELIVAARDRVR